MISDKLLAEQVQKDFAKRVNALTGALQSICYTPDFEGSENEIHLLNGALTTDMEFRPDELKICRNRLNVNYDPTAPEPERWLAFLNDLLEPEDILTLQEYMGYCLIHSTKAQARRFVVSQRIQGSETGFRHGAASIITRMTGQHSSRSRLRPHIGNDMQPVFFIFGFYRCELISFNSFSRHL